MDSGYTVGQFWGLVLQTLCLPAAAVAFMSFSLHSYKSSAWPSWVNYARHVLGVISHESLPFLSKK